MLLLETEDVELVVLPLLVMEETTFDVDEPSPTIKELPLAPDSTKTCGNSMLFLLKGDKISIGWSGEPA